MRKLQNAFHVTVKYALRGVPAEEFEAFFPEKSLAPEVLEAVYDAYCQVGIHTNAANEALCSAHHLHIPAQFTLCHSPALQVLHQARIFIDREFDEICVEKNMADKLQSLEVMCAEQGFGDGAGSG